MEENVRMNFIRSDPDPGCFSRAGSSRPGQNGDENLAAWIYYATCSKYVAICIFCIDKFHHYVIVFLYSATEAIDIKEIIDTVGGPGV